MKSISDIFKIVTTKVRKILWAFGLHAFSLILFFIFIELILGGFIFYKYVFLAERGEATSVENTFKFNEKAYQNVLVKLQTREAVPVKPASGSQQGL